MIYIFQSQNVRLMLIYYIFIYIYRYIYTIMSYILLLTSFLHLYVIIPIYSCIFLTTF